MSSLALVGGAVAGLGAAGLGLAGLLGSQWSVQIAWLVPLSGLELRMDPLAGFFLLLIGGTSVPTSIYALDRARGERTGRVAYLVFLLAMGVVPLAGNAPTFLLAWELMALASYALVLHDHDEPGVVRAAWVYAVMTHAGLASLLAGMLLLSASTGSLRFADWQAAAPGLDGATRSLAWLLLTIGFASKAGVVPHRASRRPEPCLRAHVRGDDQAGDLRAPARGARVARSRPRLVGRGAAPRRDGVRGEGRPLCPGRA